MKKLFRDRWDKKVAGICGGLGHYMGIDPTILRLLTIALCVITAGLSFLLYIIAWMLIPLGPTTYIQYKCKKLYRSVTNRKIAGVCGGLSEMFHIDANLIRLLMFVVMIVTGVLPILIAYFIGTVIIPEKPRN